MADDVHAECAGLQISNNTFSASPPGSLSRADNCVQPQKGVIEPRRGQDRAYTPPTAVEIPFALTEFQGDVIANCATSKTSESYTLGLGANPIVDFTGGPWNPVDCDGSSTAYGRMKFGFAATFLHFCTTTGPKTLETISDDPRAAGLNRMPDCEPLMQGNTQPGAWMPYNSAVAYRTVLRKPTSSGVSLLSPPSGRAVVTNRILAPIGAMVRTGGNTVTVTFPGAIDVGINAGDDFTLDPGEADFPAGPYTVATNPNTNVITYASVGANVANTVVQDFDVGTRATSVTALLSSDATTETPVRFYRSAATSDSTIEPSDEMFLIAEVFPDASDITNGTLTIDDTTPDSMLTNPLYTNPQTGEGTKQVNDAPPLYRDLASWGERQWYANTTGLQTFSLQMLGVGSPDGVQDGDTLTLTIPGASGSPYALRFKNTPATDHDVQIVSNGAVSFNVMQTAGYLVERINLLMADDEVPVRAYYNSAQNEAPGKVLIQAVSQEQEAFGVKASRIQTWTPALDTSTDVDSAAEHAPNGLAYSKVGQPEAVPPVNYTTVGSKNYAIERIIGLQNALLVFKSGDGIYSLTGSFPFQVQQISTANILAPDACAQFADAAWVYTDQGILRVTDAGGALVVSRQIETELNRLRALFPDETHDYSFAVAYETERRIMFFVPFDVDDSDRPLLSAWCYNNATQAWTGPNYVEAFSGVVGPEAERLYLGIYDDTWATGRVTVERKTQTWADYADADFGKTIDEVDVGGDPLVIHLTNATDVEAGDGIVQGNYSARIAEVRDDLGAGYFELYEDVPFTTTTCTVYKHYDVLLQFQPTGNPTSRKTLTRLVWLAKPEWFANLAGKTLVMTDQVQANDEIDTTSPGFGATPFGTSTFGNPSPLVIDVNPIDAQWATAAQFFVGFELSEAWCKLRLQGFSATLETQTGPAGRGRG